MDLKVPLRFHVMAWSMPVVQTSYMCYMDVERGPYHEHQLARSISAQECSALLCGNVAPLKSEGNRYQTKIAARQPSAKVSAKIFYLVEDHFQRWLQMALSSVNELLCMGVSYGWHLLYTQDLLWKCAKSIKLRKYSYYCLFCAAVLNLTSLASLARSIKFGGCSYIHLDVTCDLPIK